MNQLIIKKVFIILVTFLCYTSCVENVDDPILQNESVIIDSNLYNAVTTNTYTISDVSLSGDLLTIKISSSGCSADSWKASLVDANEVLESYPVQRNIKLALENNESCLAVFEKEFTFDISILTEDFSELYLNLEGWNTQIYYN